MNFSRGIFFKCEISFFFFWTNTLLFCRKSAKFAINCQNMNFSCCIYFLNAQLFATKCWLFRSNYIKFPENYHLWSAVRNTQHYNTHPKNFRILFLNVFTHYPSRNPQICGKLLCLAWCRRKKTQIGWIFKQVVEIQLMES